VKTTEYLYNIDPQQLIGMNYINALSFKVSSAKVLLAELSEKAGNSIADTKIYAPLLQRYMDVEKAIKFNNKLLRELEE